MPTLVRLTLPMDGHASEANAAHAHASEANDALAHARKANMPTPARLTLPLPMLRTLTWPS
jgi:hypothetical protein